MKNPASGVNNAAKPFCPLRPSPAPVDLAALRSRGSRDNEEIPPPYRGERGFAIDGGIASNYGANGPYHDTFGSLSTAFFYDEFLSEFVSRDEYKDYMRYIDMKAQFDVENNMPHMERKVNVRSEKTELIGSNGVHPTMDGYKQIGDCFFRALVRDMNEENK